MKTRALVELASIKDHDLFAELSSGIDAVIDNATSLWEDACSLWEVGRRRGYRVLMAAAEEEAAKALILVDAARCPRKPPKRLARHLERFYDHLAKGIYAAVCDWSPANCGDLIRYIEPERRSLYLDGLTGADWIFPNQILRQREEAIYVDFVRKGDTRGWAVPKYGDDPLLRHGLPMAPSSLSLAMAMQEAGMTSPDALAVIANIWRPIEPTPDMAWTSLRALNIRTIEEIERNGLMSTLDDERRPLATIANEWTYPLHSVDLSMIKVKRAALGDVQRIWTVDG